MAVFRFLGKSWLDQHFRKGLEQFKHEQQKQIEIVRHDINSRFSRISKIHEKEFEVLPMAWHLLHLANGAVVELTNVYQEWCDLDAMAKPQFEEWLEHTTLPTFRKDELRASTAKLRYYQEWSFWANHDAAQKACRELKNYILLNSIFMDGDLGGQFNDVNTVMSQILLEEKLSQRTGRRGNIPTNQSSLPDMLLRIEATVQKRLRYYEA